MYEITFDNYMDRKQQVDAKHAAICQWHLSAFLEQGIHLPYDPYTSYHYVSKYTENGEPDPQAAIAELKRVVRHARKMGYDVEKHYTDSSFQIEVTISVSPRVVVNYSTDRNSVCTPRVVGKRVVPAIPAREEDILEWDCEKLSLLAPDMDEVSV